MWACEDIFSDEAMTTISACLVRLGILRGTPSRINALFWWHAWSAAGDDWAHFHCRAFGTRYTCRLVGRPSFIEDWKFVGQRLGEMVSRISRVLARSTFSPLLTLTWIAPSLWWARVDWVNIGGTYRVSNSLDCSLRVKAFWLLESFEILNPFVVFIYIQI